MTEKKARTYLFVDGSNLYAGQYQLFGPDHYLNFSEFIRNVEANLKINFNKIYFYTSYSPKPLKPTNKQKMYLKNEALFYKNVRRTKNVIFFKGYRSKTSGKEKEVDVKLAVDIVDLGHRDKYQVVYLLSGDADFLQALFTIRKLRKKIFIICLQNKIMYKSAYHFLMNLIVFSKFSMRFNSGQKVKYLKLSKNTCVK